MIKRQSAIHEVVKVMVAGADFGEVHLWSRAAMLTQDPHPTRHRSPDKNRPSKTNATDQLCNSQQS